MKQSTIPITAKLTVAFNFKTHRCTQFSAMILKGQKWRGTQGRQGRQGRQDRQVGHSRTRMTVATPYPHGERMHKGKEVS